jgi:hypothetical protein
MKIRLYLWFIIIISGLAYLLTRHLIRPMVIEDNISSPFMVIINSLPNFVEAIVGTVLLTGMLFSLREYSNLAIFKMEDSKLFLAVFIIALIYTVLQELNWLNHRTDNVVDPFDFIASLTGLIIMNRLLNQFGFVKKRIVYMEEN